MSNTVHHTHRRAIRTVTPVSRAGRAGAGAAMAAAMMFGGAAAATAEPQAEAPQADAGAAMLTPVAAPAVGIPAANGSDEEEVEPALAPAPDAGTISVEVGPTEEEIAAAEAAEREAAEREAAEQEAAEQAAQEQDDQEQTQEDTSGQDDSAQDETETRQDDSASRSGERSEREDDSEQQQDSSDSDSEEKQEESSSAPSSAAKGSSVLATARSGIGTPYVFGGTSPSGWDCSGFVQWVYAQHGVSLPRGADAQAASGTTIPRSEARPGDLVWKPGHIGIYAGGNKFVDAGNSRVDTTERDIYSGSWTFVRVG